MSEPYNLFSGQSLERLTALSDGLFAVAMTLLVLDMRVPVGSAGVMYTDRGLWEALLGLGPSFAAYLLSFTMLGTFWLAQHTLLGILGRCDRTLTWINLGFLFVVSLLPFSAALLAHYARLRLGVGVYWLTRSPAMVPAPGRTTPVSQAAEDAPVTAALAGSAVLAPVSGGDDAL